MAFQQPQQRPQSSRQFPPLRTEEAQTDASPAQLQLISPVEESEEWVLFSPQPPSVTDKTQTTSTDRTPRTAGLSRLSDFGSLDTAARSGASGILDDDLVTQHGTENDEDDDLNSLDDGLHAFHEPSRSLDQSGTVLPTHDGLGSFQASSQTVQAQLWQFEKYNSRRTAKQRRRTSLPGQQLDPLEEEGEWTEDNEKTRRIEKWRIEQSIALLEEIERETRRMRRISKANASRSRASSVATNKTPTERAESAIADLSDAPQESSQPPPEEQESFWSRFTRRIIRNLMGIDESILSVILGEELPKEAFETNDEDKAIDVEAEVRGESDEDSFQGWEHRFLERIARELGILVSQLSEHPGAFSTYLRTQEPAPYAGIPIHTMSDRATYDATLDAPASTPSAHTHISSPAGGPNPYFAPTVPLQQPRGNGNSDASLWGIEEEDEEDLPGGLVSEASRLRRDKDYWERELDVKMVFDFLKHRFSSNSPPTNLQPRPFGPAPLDTAQSAHRAGVSTPITAARRQALIRQHHPLVGSSTAAAEASRIAQQRRDRDASSGNLPTQLLARQHHYGIPQHMRSGSGGGRFSSSAKSATSVASQTGSARSSKRKRSSLGRGSGGPGSSKSKSKSKSRNYWEAGGSQVGSASGVGVWGEA